MPLNTLNYNQQSFFTSNLCNPKYAYYPQTQHDYNNITQFVINGRIPSSSANSINNNTCTSSSAYSLSPNLSTPVSSLYNNYNNNNTNNNTYNNNNNDDNNDNNENNDNNDDDDDDNNNNKSLTTSTTITPLNFNNKEKNGLRDQMSEKHKSQSKPTLKSASASFKVTKPKIKKIIPKSNQSSISNEKYIPANSDVDISQFTEEDIIILKNILSLAEIHKWKHISNRLSKAKSKKLSADFCINKFHSMYGLPFNPKNSLLNSNYLLKMDNDNENGENFEGMLGSSIPYIVSKDGWNLIDE